MGRIYDALSNYLTRSEWQFAPVEDGVSVALRFKGDDDEWSCVAQALEDEGIFLFFSIVPDDVATGRRQAVGEFVTRANYGMLTGAFELSFDSGDLRYRTGLRLGLLSNDDWAAGGLAEQLVEEAVRSNLVTMNTYITALRAVVGGADPETAISEIERVASDED